MKNSFESEEHPWQKQILVCNCYMWNSVGLHQHWLQQVESARHGDIVQERFIDSYYNLTVKSLMVVKWVTQNCDSFSYVLKERWREGIDVWLQHWTVNSDRSWDLTYNLLFRKQERKLCIALPSQVKVLVSWLKNISIECPSIKRPTMMSS